MSEFSPQPTSPPEHSDVPAEAALAPTAREFLRSLHLGEQSLSGRDAEIDARLGWAWRRLEREVASRYTAEQSPQVKEEKLWLGEGPVYQPAGPDIWSRYDEIRAAVRWLQPEADDVVYDLGSGYGRFAIYGAAVSDAQFKGVELVPERVAEARRVQAEAGIDNAEFIEANVLDVDFSEGTMFYLYTPFSPRTFNVIASRLSELAAEKPIKVVGLISDTYLGRKNSELVRTGVLGRVSFYESVAPSSFLDPELAGMSLQERRRNLLIDRLISRPERT